MELMMYVGNDHIESVPLIKESLSIPGYLGSIKRQLKEKHASLIEQSSQSVEFLIIELDASKEKSGSIIS